MKNDLECKPFYWFCFFFWFCIHIFSSFMNPIFPGHTTLCPKTLTAQPQYLNSQHTHTYTYSDMHQYQIITLGSVSHHICLWLVGIIMWQFVCVCVFVCVHRHTCVCVYVEAWLETPSQLPHLADRLWLPANKSGARPKAVAMVTQWACLHGGWCWGDRLL